MRKRELKKTRAGRFRKRRGESQSFLFRDADQESKTRMRNNALRTGPRQAVDTQWIFSAPVSLEHPFGGGKHSICFPQQKNKQRWIDRKGECCNLLTRKSSSAI
ncbi:hypothetical protein TNCV_1965701 [Trichonephila clavipes]|nr:hypothetical protein TNCV_1965701 [Trichonephila clavipes]